MNLWPLWFTVKQLNTYLDITVWFKQHIFRMILVRRSKVNEEAILFFFSLCKALNNSVIDSGEVIKWSKHNKFHWFWVSTHYLYSVDKMILLHIGCVCIFPSLVIISHQIFICSCFYYLMSLHKSLL